MIDNCRTLTQFAENGRWTRVPAFSLSWLLPRSRAAVARRLYRLCRIRPVLKQP
jgi:hypothetical protein